MYFPWQAFVPGYQMQAVWPAPAPLMEISSGGFPVPESLSPEQFPPMVRASIMRLLEGPPKPSVTLEVMNRTQESMIAPDLPWQAAV